MGTANDMQVGGAHYKNAAYQPWDFALDALNGCFFLGNASKYISRHARKNGEEDLRKALHYLTKYAELLKVGRMQPISPLSPEAVDALLEHYAQAQQLGLLEQAILESMMLGDVDDAIAQLRRMIVL